MTYAALVNPFISIFPTIQDGKENRHANVIPDDAARAERTIDEYYENAAPVIQAPQNNAERLPSSDAAEAGAAAYPCCHDCGYHEPCDGHCPAVSSASLVAVQPDTKNDGFRQPAARFQVDEAAFMAELDPVPAFISRDTRTDDIEELLRIARAEEWPAPTDAGAAEGFRMSTYWTIWLFVFLPLSFAAGEEYAIWAAPPPRQTPEPRRNSPAASQGPASQGDLLAPGDRFPV